MQRKNNDVVLLLDTTLSYFKFIRIPMISPNVSALYSLLFLLLFASVPVSLNAEGIDPAAVLLFEEDFESGALGDGWVVDGGDQSRARVLLVNGSYQLVLDDSMDDDQFTQTRATSIVEGGGYGSLIISFEATNHNDEFQTSDVGLDLVDFIVAYSPVATFRLHDYLTQDSNTVKIEYEVKLDGGYAPTFGFRFWQYGSKPYPNDGWSFDNLKVYGVPYRLEQVQPSPLSTGQFDLDLRKETIPSAVYGIGNGEYLFSGDFDWFDGDPSDSVVIMDAAGQFRSIGLDLGLKGVVVDDAVRNSDGSLSLFVTYLGETVGSRYVVVSKEGELLSFSEVLPRVALLPDGRFASIELGTYENDLGYPRNRFRLRFKHIEPDGTVVTEAFASEWVNGDFGTLHRLADGSFLAIGNLLDQTETNRGHLARFTSSGNLYPDFNRYGYLDEGGNLIDWQVFSLPTGELFVINKHSSEGLKKILPSGNIDETFELDQSLVEGWTMAIYPGPGSSFYLSGASLASSFSPSVFLLKADGSLDSSFNFPGDGAPSGYDSFAWFPKGSAGGIAFAISDADAVDVFDLNGDGSFQYREASPFEKNGSLLVHWLPGGEILVTEYAAGDKARLSIARADGSIRVRSVVFDRSDVLLSLNEGGFIDSFGKRYDESLLPLAPLGLLPFTELVEVLPDGGFLARSSEDRFGSGEAFIKLKPDGSVDSGFPKLPKSSRFLDINSDYIYYAVGALNSDESKILRRVSLAGVEDESFAFEPEGVLLDNMVATDTHLYFARDDQPVSEYSKNWRGIKMTLDGVVDSSYDPNSKFNAGGSVDVVFLSDGSSIQSGSLVDSADTLAGDRLYYVSPTGDVTALDAGIRWSSPQIEISDRDDILVSGVGHSSDSGRLDIVKRYDRRAVGYSIPRKRYVVLPEGEGIVVDAGVHASGNASFQWLKDGIELDGETQTRLELPAGSSGRFELGINEDGETYAGPAFQAILARKPEISLAPQGKEALFGANVGLEARASSSLETELQWFFNDAPLEGETSPFLSISDLDLSKLGSYKLRARNTIGDTWSGVAYITGKGPVPAIRETIELVKYSDFPAKRLIPREDGSVWIVYREYQPGNDFDNFRLVKANGDIEPDFVGKVSMQSGDRVAVCPLSGTPFHIATEPRTGEGIKRHTISRLKLDGSVDDGFSPLVLDGDWSAEVELWQRSNGELLIRIGEDAYSRGIDGVVAVYPSGDLQNFLKRFEKRNIASGQEFVGVWGDGAELELFPDVQELRAKSSDGTHLWTFDLGDFYLPSVFFDPFGLTDFEYARSRTSEDGNRIYVRIYENSDFGSAFRLAWFERDGTTNLDMAASWGGGLIPQSFALSSNGNLFAAGSEVSAETGKSNFVVRTALAGTSPKQSVRLVKAVQLGMAKVIGDEDDESLYLFHDGDAFLDGAPAASLLRVNSIGELDTRFSPGLALRGMNAVVTIKSLSDGSAVVVARFGGEYEVRLLNPDGELVETFTLMSPLSTPMVASGEDGSFYLLEIAQDLQAKHLRKYDSSGNMDSAYATQLLGVDSMLEGVDSLGRVYYAESTGEGGLAVKRRDANGQLDAGYEVSSVSFEACLDGRDRLLRVSLEQGGDIVLERFLADGNVDPSFSKKIIQQDTVDDFFDLLGDRVLVGDVVLDSSGSVALDLADFDPEWKQVLGSVSTRGGFASVKVLPDIQGLLLNKWLLTDGFDLRYSPRDVRVDLDSRAQLSFDLRGFDSPQFSWYRNGVELAGHASASLELAPPIRGSRDLIEVYFDWDGLPIRIGQVSVEGNWPPLIQFSFSANSVLAFWESSETRDWSLQRYFPGQGWKSVESEYWLEADTVKAADFPSSLDASVLLLRLVSEEAF